MNKNTWRIFYILMVVGTVVPVFINYRISLGFLLGSIESLVHYKRLESFWNEVIDARVSHKTTGLGHFAITFAMMGAVLLICAFLPNIFNIYACAIGMLLVKITTYVDLLLQKKGEK